VKRLDYDCDGREEVLMTSPQLTVGIAPAYGGSVFELDFLPARFNLANTLTRRREAYHRLIATAVTTAGQHGGDQPLSIHSVQRAKEKGLEEHLVEDWYARRLFQDHFFGASATLRGFSRCRYPELGDFVNRPLEVLEAKRTKDGARVVLQREGGIYEGNAKTPVTIVKTFVIEPDGALSVRYEISSPVEKEMTAWFGSELNFTLLGSTAPGFHYDFGYRVESVSSLLDLQNIEAFSIVNTPMGFACDLALSPSAQLWSFPVETVSQSEGGLERTYQGSSLTAHWRLKLNREKPAVVSLRIKPRTL
jgi:alpha-amylase